MLETAPADQVARWASIPTDCQWYILEQPAHQPHDAVKRLQRWPHLAGGPKHWKNSMTVSAGSVCALLRAFGVEPFCTLCNSKNGAFDAHTTAWKHCQAMTKLVEQSDDLEGEEQLWDETFVVGGQVRYNHLTGELQALRDKPLLLEPVTSPQALSVSGQWILVGAAAAVPTKLGGDRSTWPSMWSIRHWKLQMERAVERVTFILEANSVPKFAGPCRICPDVYICTDHLLGPKHFGRLMECMPVTGPVPTDNFTQQWILGTATGELRFNHANGTLHMLRFPDGNEAVAPAFPPAPAPTGQSPQFFNISDDDDHDGDGDILARVLAAVRVLPPPPPPPSVEEEPCASSSQRGTSSTVAPPAADTQLAFQQQQSATAGSARDKVSPW